jgi:hypothetical protein
MFLKYSAYGARQSTSMSFTPFEVIVPPEMPSTA